MKSSKTKDILNQLFEQLGWQLEQSQGEISSGESIDGTDALEVPQEDVDEVQPLTSEGERYLVDLLVKAFAHVPDDNELKIVDGFKQEYIQNNPKEVAETIQQLLDTAPESFEDTLNKYR